MAAFNYIEVSTTYDIDFFIHLDPVPGQLLVTMEPITRYLAERGYPVQGAGYEIGGWEVQFCPVSKPLEQEAVQNAVTIDYEGVPTRAFRPEYLMALALQLGRPDKDVPRLVKFLTEYIPDDPEAMAAFKDLVRRYNLESKWEKFQQTLRSTLL